MQLQLVVVVAVVFLLLQSMYANCDPDMTLTQNAICLNYGKCHGNKGNCFVLLTVLSLPSSSTSSSEAGTATAAISVGQIQRNESFRKIKTGEQFKRKISLKLLKIISERFRKIRGMASANTSSK